MYCCHGMVLTFHLFTGFYKKNKKKKNNKVMSHNMSYTAEV